MPTGCQSKVILRSGNPGRVGLPGAVGVGQIDGLVLLVVGVENHIEQPPLPGEEDLGDSGDRLTDCAVLADSSELAGSFGDQQLPVG